VRRKCDRLLWHLVLGHRIEFYGHLLVTVYELLFFFLYVIGLVFIKFLFILTVILLVIFFLYTNEKLRSFKAFWSVILDD
jgi:hypothetical protein